MSFQDNNIQKNLPHGACIIIADDLTGACDTAIQFRNRGARYAVHVSGDLGSPYATPVHAFSTDSRDLLGPEMETRIKGIASRLAGRDPEIVFKKIDSVMRGNPGAEIAATFAAFRCEVAVITPAFPAMGRHVRQGYLHVHGEPEWKPIEIPRKLREQGLHDCVHVEAREVAMAIHEGTPYISVDAHCEADLTAIVEETLRGGRRVLWVGSAGLARALARVVCKGKPTINAPGRGSSRPVLFCVGSDHPVTLAQMAALTRERGAREFCADFTDMNHVRASLSSGEHVLLRLPRVRSLGATSLLTLLQCSRDLLGALFLSGGDTASLVCRAIQVKDIEVEREIVAGLPSGVLVGGDFDGLPVATKSGGFGHPDAFIQVADFFRCPTN